MEVIAPILSSFTHAESDLIVVGRRGRGGIHSTQLGSVSSAVVRAARGAVAVVHHHLAPAPPTGAPVVVGIDGSAASESVAAIAFDEASRRAARVVAVHAVEGRDTLWAEGLLTQSLVGFQQRYPDVGVSRVVSGAHPADALLDGLTSRPIGGVGSRGPSGLTRRLRGSVTAAVVQVCRIPVVVVSRHVNACTYSSPSRPDGATPTMVETPQLTVRRRR